MWCKILSKLVENSANFFMILRKFSGNLFKNHSNPHQNFGISSKFQRKFLKAPQQFYEVSVQLPQFFSTLKKKYFRTSSTFPPKLF